MNYYRDQITQKSWQFLVQLSQQYRFVVIGGWAVWLHTHQLKSKDIDIIIEFSELGRLAQKYPLTKNDRLKKYELRQAEIQIDVYVPHYSKLGVPAEDVIATAISIDGFRVPPAETLLTLKLTAHAARASSSKGRKDLIDIVSLLTLPNLDWSKVPPQAVKLAASQTSIPELNLNPHQFSRLKSSWPSHIL